MESVQMEEFGTDKWYRHHGYLTKLNMQAVNSAQTQGDEFVKEYLIAHQKLPLLVESLIIVELWKEKVFPHFLNSDVEPTSSFPTYTLLYHELTLANLLETITFHADATETLGDSAVDLVDWCYRSLCHLISEYSTEQSKTELIQLKDKIAEESNLEDLRRQHRLIAFDKGMKAISLVRHLLEHSLSKNSVLPLGVGRRLLHTNDVVLALCELVDKTPWTAIAMDKDTKKFSKFVWQESGIWTPDYKVTIPMGKTEGQVS
ncbi:unnamed protein product [Dicrocoelium dendriticum]|nr:unnamed protein product [Dicrocoelium dendriticum]